MFCNPVIERKPKLRRQKRIFPKQKGELQEGCLGRGRHRQAGEHSWPLISETFTCLLIAVCK